MTVATMPQERVGRAPVQRLAELRIDELAALQSIATKAAQLRQCRHEIGVAAERRDRLSVYRFSDLQSALIDQLEEEARALVSVHREHTPLVTGERPL